MRAMPALRPPDPLMPTHVCHHPSCGAFVDRSGDFCDQHAEHRRANRRPRDCYYDAHVRNPESREFYNAKRWKLARAAKLAVSPFCEQCEREWAAHVHHRKPLAQCTYDEKIDPRVLLAVCLDCHNALESDLRKAMAGALAVT